MQAHGHNPKDMGLESIDTRRNKIRLTPKRQDAIRLLRKRAIGDVAKKQHHRDFKSGCVYVERPAQRQGRVCVSCVCVF